MIFPRILFLKTGSQILGMRDRSPEQVLKPNVWHRHIAKEPVRKPPLHSESVSVMFPQSQQDRSQRIKAIALMCFAVSVFAVLDTMAKYLATKVDLPVTEVVWIRFLSNMILNMLVFGPWALSVMLKSKQRNTHLLRSTFMALTTALNFLALAYLQLDLTTTIFFVAPFVVAALGGPILGEWIGWRRMMAILVGFLGVLVVTRPGSGMMHFALIYSFSAMFAYSFYALSTRYLTQQGEETRVITFATPLVGTLLFTPFALNQWQWPADGLTWTLLIGLGFVGGFGHWLLVIAHRLAPAPIIAPFTYIGLPSAATLGYVVFGDIPDIWTLVGASIIITAGIYLIWRER
jgi:drug/metabolite transporter (DMT)-like permease